MEESLGMDRLLNSPLHLLLKRELDRYKPFTNEISDSFENGHVKETSYASLRSNGQHESSNGCCENNETQPEGTPPGQSD